MRSPLALILVALAACVPRSAPTHSGPETGRSLPPAPLVEGSLAPRVQYPHGPTACSVTGGLVYNATEVPQRFSRIGSTNGRCGAVVIWLKTPSA